MRLFALALLVTACDGSTLQLSPLEGEALCGPSAPTPLATSDLGPDEAQQLERLQSTTGTKVVELLWEDGFSDEMVLTLDVDPESLALVRTERCADRVEVTVDYEVDAGSRRLYVASSRRVALSDAFRNDAFGLGHRLVDDEAAHIRETLNLDDWQGVWFDIRATADDVEWAEVAYSTSQTSTTCERAAVLATASDALAGACD